MCPYDGGVYHHAHGDEEDGSEEVLDALQKVLDALAFNGLRQYGTHHEGAEGGGETGRGGQRHHAEAEADGDNQEDLVVQVLLGLLQQDRNNVDAYQEPQDQEKRQPGEAEDHFSAGELVGDGHGRQQHHEQHGYQVLNHQHAENQPGVRFLLEPQVVEGLDDYGSGAHREQASQEYAFHHGPSECVANYDAHDEHAYAVGGAGDQGAASDFQEALEAEFETQGEEQEDYSDFGPLVYGFGAGDIGEEVQVGTDQESGDYISQDKRLLERPGYHRKDSCRDEDQRKVLNQVYFFRHLLYSVNASASRSMALRSWGTSST